MAQNTHKKGHGKHSKAIFSGRSPQLQPRAAPLSTHFEIPIPHLFVVRKVTGVKELQRRLEAGGGVIARRANPDLSGSLDRARRAERIVSVAPGVYCAAGWQDDPWVRLRAAALWAGPDAIFTGVAAAKLTFWESVPLGRITLAVSRHGARSRSGLSVEQRRIDPRFTVRRSGITATSPALTAVDLAASELGGDVIDRVLRLRTATLEQMWSAWRAHPHRAGNAARVQLLNDSRDLPWSKAERLQHRLLRAAHIMGWKANQWVSCGTVGYWVDVLFSTSLDLGDRRLGDAWHSTGVRGGSASTQLLGAGWLCGAQLHLPAACGGAPVGY
jgi:hypothetical protein